jgi:hypothetical protein
MDEYVYGYTKVWQPPYSQGDSFSLQMHGPFLFSSVFSRKMDALLASNPPPPPSHTVISHKVQILWDLYYKDKPFAISLLLWESTEEVKPKPPCVTVSSMPYQTISNCPKANSIQLFQLEAGFTACLKFPPLDN